MSNPADLLTPSASRALLLPLGGVGACRLHLCWQAASFAELAAFGISSTPAIMTKGLAVQAGGLPKSEDLPRWLAV